MVCVFTPGSVLPLQLDFVPEQDIQVCDLHLSLSTGSQTPGWDFAEPVGAGPPTVHMQPGSPSDKGISQSVTGCISHAQGKSYTIKFAICCFVSFLIDCVWCFAEDNNNNDN